MQIPFWPVFALSCLLPLVAPKGLLPKAGCIKRIRRNAKREDGLTILDLFEDISLSPAVIARADLEKRQSPDSTCACYDTSPTYYPVETLPSYMATPYGNCDIAAKESNLCPSDFLCACQTNGTSSICLPTTVQATTECNTVYPGPFPSSTETRWLYSYAPTDLAAPSGQCGGTVQPAATTEWSPSQTVCPDGQACQCQSTGYSMCVDSVTSGYRGTDCPNACSSYRYEYLVSLPPPSATAAMGGQCGGKCWSGPTNCPSGASCYSETSPVPGAYAKCATARPGSSFKIRRMEGLDVPMKARAIATRIYF